MTITDTIPTLTTVEDAHAKLRELAEHHEWVSVFWDRGWGDSGQTAEISIIVNGNGQEPLAWLTAEVYRALRDQRTVGENTLMTYKKRRVHDFKAPPVEEPTGPTANDVAEEVIRSIMADRPDLPIVARFYRGLERGPFGPVINEDFVETPAADSGWFVMLIPGHSDVAMSAQEPDFLGPRIIGGGVADCLSYPQTGDEVDLEALAGETFRARLLAAIDEKVAVIAAARAQGEADGG
jgi:hypothetical protein